MLRTCVCGRKRRPMLLPMAGFQAKLAREAGQRIDLIYDLTKVLLLGILHWEWEERCVRQISHLTYHPWLELRDCLSLILRLPLISDGWIQPALTPYTLSSRKSISVQDLLVLSALSLIHTELQLILVALCQVFWSEHFSSFHSSD